MGADFAVGFYFRVSLGLDDSDADNGFQEVSGISATLHTEEIQEGGLNRYKHKVPGASRYTNLVLKRGYIASGSTLATWFIKTLNSGLTEPIPTHTINVMLLDEKGSPLKTWTFQDAWPVKWSISEFNAQDHKLVVESLEFSYSRADV